jgi:hypothetical protein
MASGSYNIDTYSWYRSLPLSNDTMPYSTYQMFAVGKSSFLEAFTFYQYTTSSGFVDTSTLSAAIINVLNSSLISIGKIFVSTIPYTRYTDTTSTGNYTQTFPFNYPSTFNRTVSSFTSTFGPPPGTVSTFVSTGAFGPFTSTLAATPSPYDFTSTYNGGSAQYPLEIITPKLWLGTSMQALLDAQNQNNPGQYNAFVEFQYSLYLSSLSTSYSWVSTTGTFGPTATGEGNIGRTVTTRVGMSNYAHIREKLSFAAESATGGGGRDIGFFASNFTITLNLQSSFTTTTSFAAPAFDIYIPGENNFTFTLVPVTSSIVYPP